ncbi:MAG: hypothetical protein ACK5Y2_01645 [Bdellovibrionales bacterium]
MWLIFGLGIWALSPSLEGLWERPCDRGTRQFQSFSGPHSHSQDILYRDPSCSIPVLRFENLGRYETRPGEIDFTFSRVLVTVESSEMLHDFRVRRVCGASDWTLGLKKDVTGLRCAFFQRDRLIQVPRAGEGRYGIWKIEGAQLYFGRLDRATPGTSPALRPREWDLRPYFKQP